MVSDGIGRGTPPERRLSYSGFQDFRICCVDTIRHSQRRATRDTPSDDLFLDDTGYQFIPPGTPVTALHARAIALFGCLALSALVLTSCGASPTDTPAKPSVATSAANAGGMDALIAAAKQEGKLNLMGLPRDWAGYGALIDGFEKKYGIDVRDENPWWATVSDQINGVKNRKGQANALDVIGADDASMRAAARQHLLAPYRVAAYNVIPNNQKDPNARWANSYGGYISIGCDAARVEECPRTFADLLKPRYKGKVSVTDPTGYVPGFATVYAAALANNGSFDDINPGIDFFAKLKKIGNDNPIPLSVATIENGQTPISIGFDFTNLTYAGDLRSKGVKWRVSIPFDGSFAQYYAEGINRDAPHPAAARLWLEWLLSPEGQNLRLDGYARPVLMDVMEKNGTLDKVAASKLPIVEGTPEFPTDAQLEKARAAIIRDWLKTVGG